MQQASSLPAAMRAAIIHKEVTIELLSGLRITGRLVAFDADTMNLRLDSITCASVVSRDADIVENPPQLQPLLQSIVVRGSCLQSIDVVEPKAAALVETAVQSVRAGGASAS